MGTYKVVGEITTGEQISYKLRKVMWKYHAGKSVDTKKRDLRVVREILFGKSRDIKAGIPGRTVSAKTRRWEEFSVLSELKRGQLWLFSVRRVVKEELESLRLFREAVEAF